MKAFVISGNRHEFRDDAPLPIRRAGEAFIKVTVAGICTSDLELLKGDSDFYGIPGHEFTGVVEDADDAKVIGKRVVAEVHASCGHCQLCRMGLWRHCRSRTSIGMHKRDGAFAEYLVIPQVNLHLLPDDMSDETAVFVEPTSTVYAILDHVSPKPADRCVVVGDDALALITARVMSTRCSAVMVGHNSARVDTARALGITAALDAKFDERDFDIAVEATGVADAVMTSLAMLRPAGTLVLKATVPGLTPLPLWKIANNEITVIGSRCGPFLPAIEALHRGIVNVAPLITARFSLDNVCDALAKAAEPDTLKVLLYPAGLP